MAKAAKTASPSTMENMPKSNKGKKLIITLLIVLILLLLMAIGFFGLLLMKKGGGAKPADPQAETAPNASLPLAPPISVDLNKPPAFVTLDPFVVNLAQDEGDRYLQAVIVFRVPDVKTGDALKNFMPTIRHRINIILSSKLPSEIGTPQGREALALQIGQEINEALGYPVQRDNGQPMGLSGPIQAVLFNSFIIQ